MCDEGTANSVARVAAVAQVGYFENTVAGEITELRVAVFRATFIIYRGRPKVYIDKKKIKWILLLMCTNSSTNTTWNV